MNAPKFHSGVQLVFFGRVIKIAVDLHSRRQNFCETCAIPTTLQVSILRNDFRKHFLKGEKLCALSSFSFFFVLKLSFFFEIHRKNYGHTDKRQFFFVKKHRFFLFVQNKLRYFLRIYCTICCARQAETSFAVCTVLSYRVSRQRKKTGEQQQRLQLWFIHIFHSFCFIFPFRFHCKLLCISHYTYIASRAQFYSIFPYPLLSNSVVSSRFTCDSLFLYIFIRLF